METTTSTAHTTQDHLENLMALFAESNQRYEAEIKMLRETIRLLEGQLYGRKSEKKLIPGDQKQLLLFEEEAEDVPSEQEANPEEERETDSYKRRKRGRRPLPADLPRVDVVHDLDEQDKV